MENITDVITSTTNTNILVGIVRQNVSKNALARASGIPLTTFSRKINGHGDFTLRELGDIAAALGMTLADILPVGLISTQSAA
ncbi:helix-turn-helix transcriptional regulator [Arthrobacter sp. GMC3]|uniref:helix-turn-helix domain-containing protein n=1 Tax=Arthrobacter sp. GMC3 TaxID=2058894 RepID=UPI000CE2C537|nr:helix-turn-helix transcriptional regulator [Arthrobacter sp. GMC3]